MAQGQVWPGNQTCPLANILVFCMYQYFHYESLIPVFYNFDRMLGLHERMEISGFGVDIYCIVPQLPLVEQIYKIYIVAVPFIRH